MKKTHCKIISLFLAMFLVVGMLPLSAFAAELPFTDVPASAWYHGAVAYAYENGLFNGTGATTFSPMRPMTRGMFVTVLANATDNYRKEDWTGRTSFTDVNTGLYYAAPIEWAYQMGLINGVGNRKFAPDTPVTRQQMAKIFYDYAAKTGNTTAYSNTTFHSFPDKTQVSAYAKTGLKWAADHKIINGSSEGGKNYLKPQSTATRAEVAQVFKNAQSVLLKHTVDQSIVIPEKDPTDIDPVEPEPTFQAPVKFSKTAGGVSVSGVEFNPQKGYSAQAVLANNKLYSTESAAAIAKRTNAIIAVNGAFYQCYDSSKSDYLTTYSTLISNGKLLRLDNTNAPYKPTFVVDSNGKASIEFFKTLQSVTHFRDGKVIEAPGTDQIGLNLSVPQNDGTKMIATSAFGSKISGKVLNAAVADENGTVTKVYHNASDVPIPKTGFVLYERKMRSQWDTLVGSCQVGDTLELSVKYQGSSTQDIIAALSCGPTVVKNGKAYGNASTYQQEGFTDAHVTGTSAARMAIGVKKDGTVVIAHASCTLGQLGSAMAALGCQTAMNLDGGASCALYVQGSTAVSAGRAMSNMLVFTQK